MSNLLKSYMIIPSLNQGGAERVMCILANQFCNYENIEVHLILLTNSELFYELDPKVQLYQLGFENKNKLQKLNAEIKTYFRLRRILTKHKPDVILSFMMKYNIFTILAASFTGIPVFISERSNPLKKRPWHLNILRKLTYPRAKGIIAQTEFAKEILEKEVKHKNIKVIANPLKTINTYPNSTRENIVINVGRLVLEKGQKYLIEAFAELDPDDWKLFILGEGPLRKTLENQIKEMGMEDKIILPGAVKNVDEWLARASIFVFPSISEGFPNALAEAMAAGLPCISFDCDSGPREIIRNGENGILLKVKDVEGLKQCLEEMMNDQKLRNTLGVKAMNVINRFSSESISKTYLSFITE